MGDCQFRKAIKNNDKYVNIFNRAKERISHVKNLHRNINRDESIHFYTILKKIINRKKQN